MRCSAAAPPASFGETARPQDAVSEVEDERRNEDRPDDQRVEEDAERDDEPQFAQDNDREQPRIENVPASTTPADVMTAAGHGETSEHPLAGFRAPYLFAYSTHQEML